MIPILRNHNSREAIGKIAADKNTLVVEFLPDAHITLDKIFSIFGNIGFELIDSELRDEVTIIRKFQIREFSIEG